MAIERGAASVHSSTPARGRLQRHHLIGSALLITLVLGACRPSPAERSSGFEGSKIGFIFVGARDDLGYNQAAWEGADSVAETFPDMQLLRQENVPETEAATQALEEMVSQGARILFVTSFGHLKYALPVATKHPDVIVVHQGGVEPSPKLDNLGTYWGSVYEPVYQAGIAAGTATKTNKLGYVVAFPIPATFDNVNAFTLGAQSVNPNVATQVSFTEDWCDPTKQADAARKLLALGVDVLTQHQDCTRTILEAAESAGISSVGYHYDGSEVAPKGWLVGAVWNWRSLFVDIVRTIVEGRFKASPYNGDFRGSYRSGNNPFVLTEFGAAVAPQTRQLILKAGKRFQSGGSPFQGPIYDRSGKLRVAAGIVPTAEELDTVDYFVAGVEGEIPSK